MALSPTMLYHLLRKHFGSQHWWPVDTRYHHQHGSDPRFEVMIGAILTQNTAWTNVEKALTNLKQHQALTIPSIATMDIEALKRWIQPSGFFNQKAHRLKIFSSYLHENYHDDITHFFTRNSSEIRQELLSLQGIGPETADSILLYAGDHPVFVVDAYTKRICSRIPLLTNNDTYEEIQHFFETDLQKNISLQQRVTVYKELHALLVELAKNICKKKPLCDTCPVTKLCEKAL